MTSSWSSKKNAIVQFINNLSLGLKDQDKLKLSNLLHYTIGVKTIRTEDSKLSVGISKIGGLPDLPKEFSWPEYRNEPLTFCAQYNLEQLAKYDHENKLPDQGMLYLFLYIDQKWGGFYNYRDSCKLVYIPDSNELERSSFPVGYYNAGKISSARMDFFEFFTLPDDENYKLDVLENEIDNFDMVYESIQDYIHDLTGQELDNLHQVLGEDRAIQSSVGYDFAMKHLNIDSQEAYVEKKDQMMDLAREYELLIQLDCNDANTNLGEFGGSSTIYLGLRKEELERKDLSNIVIVFQTT